MRKSYRVSSVVIYVSLIPNESGKKRTYLTSPKNKKLVNRRLTSLLCARDWNFFARYACSEDQKKVVLPNAFIPLRGIPAFLFLRL